MNGIHLVLINGSSRAASSNTKLLVESLEKGFLATVGNSSELLFLGDGTQTAMIVAHAVDADAAAIVFPLRNGHVPTLVQQFLVSGDAHWERVGDQKSDAASLIPACEALASRVGCHYILLVLKGLSGGATIIPGWITHRVFVDYLALGRQWGAGRSFARHTLHRLEHPPRLLPPIAWFFHLLKRLGLRSVRIEERLRTDAAFSRKHNRRHR